MSQPPIVERHQDVGTEERIDDREHLPSQRVPGSALELPSANEVRRGLAEDEFVALYPALHRFACVTADLDLDPDDLVQEALTRFLRVRDSREIDRPDAYLRRTIVNLVMSHRRRAGTGRSKGRTDMGPADGPDVYPSDVDGLLDRVGPVERALLTMTVLEGLSTAEAARALGLSPTATRARLSRAKRTLRVEEDR